MENATGLETASDGCDAITRHIHVGEGGPSAHSGHAGNLPNVTVWDMIGVSKRLSEPQTAAVTAIRQLASSEILHPVLRTPPRMPQL